MWLILCFMCQLGCTMVVVVWLNASLDSTIKFFFLNMINIYNQLILSKADYSLSSGWASSY